MTSKKPAKSVRGDQKADVPGPNADGSDPPMTSAEPEAGPASSTFCEQTGASSPQDVRSDRARAREYREGVKRLGGPTPTKAFMLQRRVERLASERVPTSVIAESLNISPRQVRRYLARARAALVERVGSGLLDDALVRLQSDAAKAREIGGVEGLRVAIQAERAMLDLVGRRVGFAVDAAAREEGARPPIDAEDALHELAAAASLHERLALAAGNDPNAPEAPAPIVVVEEVTAIPDAPHTPPAEPARPWSPPPEREPRAPARVIEEVVERVVERRSRREYPQTAKGGMSWSEYLGREPAPADPDDPCKGMDLGQQEVMRIREGRRRRW